MLLIPCPWCGPRDEIEYRYGGQAFVQRPGPDVSESEWADYLFTRDNPRGAHRERWHHFAGCRQWLNVERDTLTHRILAVAAPDQPSGERP